MTGLSAYGAASPGRSISFHLIALLVAASLPGLAVGSEMEACRRIASDSARLACYDALADSASSANEAPAAISAESLFGRDATRTSTALQQQTGIKPPQILDTEIMLVKTRADGKLLITLQNGQRWEQIDGRPLPLAPGDSIRIRKAAFGSWLLYKQAGGRSIRVRRTD